MPVTTTPSFRPPLRLAILSSGESQGVLRARELEKTLNGTAAGIGWDVGQPESPEPGEEMLGEKLEMRVFRQPPQQPAAEFLDATLHTVVVALVDDALLKQAEAMEWLTICGRHLDKEPRRHTLLSVPFNDDIQARWLASSPELGRVQTLPWTSLGPEPAGRQDQLALQTLHRLIRTVARPIFQEYGWKLRTFLSHAKLDGLQLAQSLRHFLDQQRWLENFYDARDVEAGSDWQDELRDGVAHSVLVVLRTDAYDRRLWCRQEVRWADTFAVPRVVVDARSGLVHPGSDLSMESCPTVRVPDGNLGRILFALLQTAMRSLLFQRRVLELRQLDHLPREIEDIRTLQVSPSIDALAHACAALGPPAANPRFVIYPDPPLRPGLRDAAEALARSVGARLLTPQQVLAEVSP